MIEKRDVEALMDAFSEVVNGHIKEVVSTLRRENDEAIKRHIAALPPGLPGKDAATVDVEAIAERAASLIRPPKDGKDADPVDVDSIVLRVAELVPKGKDAEPVDEAALESRILAKIPKPENGKDAPPVDTAAIVVEVLKQVPVPEVVDPVQWFDQNRNGFRERVLREIPPPENGKDAEPVDIDQVAAKAASLIPAPKDPAPVDEDSIAARVLLQIPKPENGKDAPPVDVDAVVLRVAELFRQPEDGKDAPPVDTAAIAAEVLKQVRVPQDGRDADPEQVRQFVAAEVQRVVSGIPAPKDGAKGDRGDDGASVHPDTVALMVREAVDKVAAAIPKPEPGQPGRDAIQIDILPTLDPQRSYPRNTYAEYDGGTIRSIRQTTPGETINPSEWSVGLSGLAEYGEEMSEDCRTLTVWNRRTLSEKQFKTYRLSHPECREFWKVGETYYRGQFVVSSNSIWLCKAAETQHKPGTAPSDWQLILKAPRDGKDGKLPEAPAPNGPIRLK